MQCCISIKVHISDESLSCDQQMPEMFYVAFPRICKERITSGNDS